MSRDLLFSLSFLLFLVHTLTSECPRMKCGDIPQSLSADSGSVICGLKSLTAQDQVVQTLQQCKVGEEDCAYSSVLSKSFCYNQRISNHRKYAGEECMEPGECMTGVCDFGVCKGNVAGEQCSEDAVCDMGLFCNRKEHKCEQFRKIGEACDSAKSKCISVGVCYNHICTKLLSLPAGQVISGANTTGGMPSLCSALTVITNSKKELVCSEGYKLTGPIERSSINDTCKYTLVGEEGVIMTQMDPECGLSKSGSYYCPLGNGDLQEELNQIRGFFSKSPMCPKPHTLDFNCKNTEGIEGRENALAALYLTRNLEEIGFSIKSVSIRNNDDCVKSMFTKDYWSHMTVDNTQESNASMRLHLSFLALAALIITTMLQVV